jgi:hypothetical protein
MVPVVIAGASGSFAVSRPSNSDELEPNKKIAVPTAHESFRDSFSTRICQGTKSWNPGLVCPFFHW